METDNVNDSDQLQAMPKEKLIALVIELRKANNLLREEIIRDDRARVKLTTVKESLANTLKFIGESY